MHKVHSQGRVPFSWENKPGESKLSSTKPNDLDDHNNEMSQFEVATKLPIPLPPCALQPPLQQGSSSKRFLKKNDNDDPFMIAIKQCTRSSGEKDGLLIRTGSGFGIKVKKNKSLFSCKKSCNVVIGSTIKVPQVPISEINEI